MGTLATAMLLLAIAPVAQANEANDPFAGAEPISTTTFSVTGNNIGATRDPGDPGSTSASVWYAWTPTTTGRIAIDDDDCDFDSYLRVYSGGASLATLNVIAANDDGSTAYCSALNIDATAGTTYYIAVGGYCTTCFGNFTLRGVAGPANDAFAAATPIAWDTGTITGVTNVGATLDVGEPASTFSSIWYSWTPTQTGQVWFDAWELECWSRMIRIYTGTTLAGLTQVATASNGCPTRASANVTAGTTYYIAIGQSYDTWGGSPFEVRIRRAAANDAFASAELLTGDDASALGTNFGATDDVGEPQTTFASVWYDWTPSTSRTVSIRTRDCSFNSYLRLYTGTTLGTLTQVAANDNGESGTCSFIRTTVTAGTTYRIAVGGNAAGLTGDFRLTIDAEPTNDEFASATAIAGDAVVVTSSNFGATPDLGDPSNMPGSVWYRWTPAHSGTAYINARTCNFDSYLRVYRGTALGSLTELASNDDHIGTDCSAVNADVTAGTAYYIQLGSSWAGAYGTFTLRTSLTIGNDMFAGATSLTNQFTQLNGVASARVRAQAATTEPGRSAAAPDRAD